MKNRIATKVLETGAITLALGLSVLASSASAAEGFSFLVDLAFTVYGWIVIFGIAIAVITISVGIVKYLLTMHNVDDKAGGTHKGAVEMVKSGVIALALLVLIGPILTTVVKAAGVVGAATCTKATLEGTGNAALTSKLNEQCIKTNQ